MLPSDPSEAKAPDSADASAVGPEAPSMVEQSSGPLLAHGRHGANFHEGPFTRSAREAAEDALREREEQLRSITDALPVLVSLVDREQRYRFVSAAYERWFGHSRAKLLGKRLDEVLGEDAYAAIRPHVERALDGRSTSFEAELPYRDGGSRHVEASYIPQRASDGLVSGFVALVVDITERKRLERARTRAAHRAERLLEVTTAMADAISAAQVFEAVVDPVAEAVGASTAALWLLDESARTLRLVRARGYPPATSQELQVLPLDLQPRLPILDAARQREPLWLPSRARLLERYPQLRSALPPAPACAVACLPLLAQERVLGVLAVTSDEARESGDEEREFLLLVAGYASQALERVRLLEAERRSSAAARAAAARLGLLNRASHAFGANLELESRLRAVVIELATVFDSCVNIALVEPDGSLRLTTVFHPIAEAQERLEALAPSVPMRLGEGVTGKVAATGESVLLSSISRELLASHAVPGYREFLERFPAYALIAVPLKVSGRVLGTVTASRIRPSETYTTEDLRLLEELAERAAVAIENSRLYEETAAARSRAEQLYRFAQAVVGANQIDAVYAAALACISAALRIQRAAVLTYDADGMLRLVAWRGLSDAHREALEGYSPWARDVASPQPVLVTDAASEPSLSAYHPLFRQEGIGGVAFIPLVTRGRLLGQLLVYHELSHRFVAHEIETASAIGNHLASVITRFATVRALEETIRQNELFAGVLAHDLRNPLAAIMTAAQIVLMQREGEGASAGEERRPLSRILSSGQRMTAMITQLLDFTLARSGGGISIQPDAADLAELCAQAVSELDLAHPEWNIQCKFAGDSRGSWDAHRLVQVLSNLVANAGQHGVPAGGVTLALDGTQPAHVRVLVHNHGSIPAALLPHLFDPFRSTRHRGAQSSGLGLGLFIVREIVRAHGGSVEVSSSEATGTTITLQLPRRAVAPSTAPQT